MQGQNSFLPVLSTRFYTFFYIINGKKLVNWEVQYDDSGFAVDSCPKHYNCHHAVVLIARLFRALDEAIEISSVSLKLGLKLL